MFNIGCELSQPIGKTEFSSTAKNRTDSVSLVRKFFTTPVALFALIVFESLHPHRHIISNN